MKERFIAQSRAMRDLVEQVRRFAQTDRTSSLPAKPARAERHRASCTNAAKGETPS
jgi:hypothetical protein